jgi:hypothetical protein
MQNQGGNGNSHTTVSSFNLSTGAINWSYTGDFVFPSQPGVGGGFVTFVGSTLSSFSLYVLDAVTGTLRYTVPIPEGWGSMMPTIVQDTISGNVTAFVADGFQVSAVSLGPASGSVRWTFHGSFGGDSIPTVVGSSIVLAGPGQYYAFDQATPAMNHFWSGSISGGGGSTVAYDAARQQFYVLEFYDHNEPMTLSAYHYTDNAHITLLWQRTGAGVGGGSSVAIGPTGKVYSAGYSVIWELDPATGTTLRSIPGSFASGVTPALTNNVLWIIGTSQVFAYDLLTLQLLRGFHPSRGDLNTPYQSPGAFADGYFVVDYNGFRSFDVYKAPSPTPRFDFNRDAKQDYLLYNPGTRQTAVWYLNNNVLIGGAAAPPPPVGWRVMDVADFNRDGRPDYALFNASTRQTAIWYLSGVNGVTFIGSNWGPTPPSGWALVATGDFNNDGKPDCVIFNASTRQTAIWYLNNNVYAGGAYGPSIPSPWSLVGIAEFSSDGKPDYLLFNPSTLSSVIWYLSGTTRIGSAFGPTIAAGFNLTGAADFNRDYKPDYLLFNPSTRGTAIWYLNNNVRVGTAVGPTPPAGYTLAAP